MGADRLWQCNQGLKTFPKHFFSACPQSRIARLGWQADDLGYRKTFLLHPLHPWLSPGDISIERRFHLVS
jgi:hypothetical protein